MITPQLAAEQRPPLLAFPTLPKNEDDLLAQAWPDLKKIGRAWSPSGRRVVDEEDLTQAAAIGLLRAYKTFDPGRGVPLHHYAYGFIKEKLVRQLKLLHPAASIETDEAKSELQRVRQLAVDREAEQQEAAQSVGEALGVLTRAQHQVVTLRYFEEMKTIDISAHLRRHPDTVRQMLDRARVRLAGSAALSEYAA